MKPASAILALGVTLMGPQAWPSPKDAPAASDRVVLAAFAERVKEYAALHRSAARALPGLKKETDAQAITAHEKALGEAIRARRKGAREGEVFTEAGARYLRALIAREVAAPGGDAVREETREGNPRSEAPAEPVLVGVNAAYPPGAPLSTVPPALLLSLPALPSELEYRFVGRDLVLRDTVANLIVDFISNAVP